MGGCCSYVDESEQVMEEFKWDEKMEASLARTMDAFRNTPLQGHLHRQLPPPHRNHIQMQRQQHQEEIILPQIISNEPNQIDIPLDDHHDITGICCSCMNESDEEFDEFKYNEETDKAIVRKMNAFRDVRFGDHDHHRNHRNHRQRQRQQHQVAIALPQIILNTLNESNEQNEIGSHPNNEELRNHRMMHKF